MRALGVALIGAVALASAACDRTAPAPRAADASTITVLYHGDETILGASMDAPAKFLVFLPLVRRDSAGNLQGRLARRWEHSPDHRTWTFHLRTDVRWHDGVPVTAHDAKFTLELFQHLAMGFAAPDAYRVEAPDDSTLVVRYARLPVANAELPDDWSVVYPKHLLENLDPEEVFTWEFWKRPVGNGPYRYVRHLPRTMLELEANPDFPLGEPRIRRVVLKFGEGSLVELLSGNVDAVPYLDEAGITKLQGDPRFVVYRHVGAHPGMVVWNARRFAPFADPDVRRALTLAIDRRGLLRMGNLPDDVPVLDGMVTASQLRRGELPEAAPYDPSEAERLLERAGWRDTDGDGVREKEGRPLRFSVMGWGRGTDRVAVYLQAQFRRVGVQMELEPVDPAVASRRFLDGDFEAGIGSVFTPGRPFGRPGFFGLESRIGYTNPRVAALVERGERTLDPDEIDVLHRELNAIFRDDPIGTFLAPRVTRSVATRRVRGLSSPYRIDPVVYMDELWLEEER